MDVACYRRRAASFRGRDRRGLYVDADHRRSIVRRNNIRHVKYHYHCFVFFTVTVVVIVIVIISIIIISSVA